MRGRSLWALLALTALAGLLALAVGCGSKFELPTEHRIGRGIPSDKSYQMLSTWHDLVGIQDVLLTQGVGSQLFLMFNYGLAGPPPFILDVALTRPLDLGHRFNQLINPVRMCVGGDGVAGQANRIFVLDQGDTCRAKINPRTGMCDTTGVTNLGFYWRVREYGLLGGDTLSTFTDLNFASVEGVASDVQGNVYVSGTAIVFLPDNTSPFLRLRVFQHRIFKYTKGQRYPGVNPPDRNMPGANWHRDTTYAHSDGTGIGFVDSPRGLFWSGVGVRGLLVADAGNNSAELVSDVDSTGFFRLEQDGDGAPIQAPTDVAADFSGFLYVCDTGNARVLRYDPYGAFVQKVNVQNDDMSRPLQNPVAVTADDSLVYVADRALNEIVRYQRRK